MTRRGRRLVRRVVIAGSAIWAVFALTAGLHYLQVYFSLIVGGDGGDGVADHQLLKAQIAFGLAIGIPIIALKISAIVWAVRSSAPAARLDITAPDE